MTRERSIIKRGVLFNYLYLGAGFVWVFLLTPVILKHLGPEKYGFWAILTSLVTYLTMFNFGLNTAVAKYTAEYMAKDRRNDVASLISTTAVTMAVLGVVILVVCVIVSPLVPWLFNLGGSLLSESKVAFIITALNVCLMLLWGIFGNALYGLQRVDLWMLLRTGHLLLCAALVAISLKVGLGLIGVVAAMTTSHIVLLIAFSRILASKPFEVRCRPRLASFRMLREIAPFSGRTFILGLCNCLSNYKDYIVIGVLLGSAMVTPYEVVYKLCIQATFFFSVISNTLFPKFAVMYAKGDVEHLRLAYMHVAKLSLAIMVPVALCLLLYGETFIGLWVGRDNFAGYGVLGTLVAMSVVHAIGTPTVNVIQSIGKNREITCSEVVNALLNLVLSVVLLKRYGIVGVAIGTLGASLLTSSWVLIYSAHKHINLEVKRYFLAALMPPILAGFATAFVAVVLRSVVPMPGSIVSLLVCCAVIVLIYIVVYVLFFINIEERRLYLGFVTQKWDLLARQEV